MKKNLKVLGSTLVVLFAMVACEMYSLPDYREFKHAGNGFIKSYNNNMVLKWDEAVSTAIDAKLTSPAESRIYAMVTLAMHDALNNIIPKYETYALEFSGIGTKAVSKKTIYSFADAAVAQAAHDVLVALYPLSQQNADELLTTCLSEIEDSEYKDKGIQIGQEAAQAVLTKRQNDVLPKFEAYPQGTEPGQYKSTMPWAAANLPVWPANAVYAPFWGETEPFGILSGDQFRPEPPFDINSPEYTADYIEVKSLGSNTSAVRTTDQTEMGVFFTDNMPSMMNRVARVIADQEKLNGWETARLFALIQMAGADALICAFDGPYHYNFWRPITAITQGEDDGNDYTGGDTGWIPLLSARPTPPLPSYPLGYAAVGTAGAEVFKMFFKTDKKSFTVGSYSLPGAERSYTSFSQLADEMGVSRIYTGHNFRNDKIAGDTMGKEVGKFVFRHNLREL